MEELTAILEMPRSRTDKRIVFSPESFLLAGAMSMSLLWRRLLSDQKTRDNDDASPRGRTAGVYIH